MLPCLILLGIAFGVLAKAGDVSGHGDIIREIFSSFGTVSTGVFIWAVVCTIIAVLSPNKVLAAVNVFLFLSAAIISYYLYSYFVVHYFVWRIAKFWLIMLVPSMILGFIVWHVKVSRVLKYLTIIFGTLIMIYDIFFLQGGITPISLIMNMILYVIFLVFLISASSKKIETDL